MRPSGATLNYGTVKSSSTALSNGMIANWTRSAGLPQSVLVIWAQVALRSGDIWLECNDDRAGDCRHLSEIARSHLAA